MIIPGGELLSIHLSNSLVVLKFTFFVAVEANDGEQLFPSACGCESGTGGVQGGSVGGLGVGAVLNGRVNPPRAPSNPPCPNQHLLPSLP